LSVVSEGLDTLSVHYLQDLQAQITSTSQSETTEKFEQVRREFASKETEVENLKEELLAIRKENSVCGGFF